MSVEPFLALLAAIFLCVVLLALVGFAPVMMLPIVMMASDSPHLTRANSYEILFLLLAGPWIVLISFTVLSIWLFTKERPKTATLMSAVPLLLILASLKLMRII
jgi:hypothetical protein